MAIRASDMVTLVVLPSPSYVRQYYLLQSSTLAIPLVPTTNPPSNPWSVTEPAYTASSTDTLYTVMLTAYGSVAFEYGPVQKSSSYEAAKQAYNLATGAGSAAAQAAAAAAAAAAIANGVATRGTDLVTNGSAQMGTNYNFSTWTLEKGDQPVGTGGAFYAGATAGISKSIDEFIAVDPSKKYATSLWARQLTPGLLSYFYYFVSPYDIDKLSIQPTHYMEQANTRTTLAADLVPGQTTMALTSAANWNNAAGVNTHFRNVIIWNYIDGTGKAWAPGTYSRNSRANAYADGGINFTTNVVTLSAPWSGALVPAGTPISNGSSGGNYLYPLSNQPIPAATPASSWVQYVGLTIGGIHTDNTRNASSGFPVATASVKVGVLANYGATGTTSKQLFAGFSFSDVVAAQQTADSKNKVIFSTLPATGVTGYVAGDVWFQKSGALIIAQWEFTTIWQSRTIDNAVIANLNASKLTAGTIHVDRIAANSMTVDKLIVADFENLFPDPYWTGAGESLGIVPKASSDSSVPVGSPAYNVGVGSNDRAGTSWYPVKAGDQFYIEYWAAAGATATNPFGVGLQSSTEAGVTSIQYVLAPITGKTWIKYSGTLTIPAGHTKVRVYTHTAAASAGKWWFTGSLIRRMAAGELIVDGAITSQKVNAEEIWANEAWIGKAQVNVLTAGIIETNMLHPSVGDQLNISANGSVNIIVGQIADVATAADDAATKAALAQTQADSAQGAASSAQSTAEAAEIAAQAAAQAGLATADNLALMQTYYSFGADGAVIGKPLSPYQLAMKNDRIEMLENGNVVSYWNAGQMYVSQFIGEKVILGNHQLEKYGTSTVVRAL